MIKLSSRILDYALYMHVQFKKKCILSSKSQQFTRVFYSKNTRILILSSIFFITKV